MRALYEAMNPLDAMTLDELVRLWANEALRLFHDRLVTEDERAWCQEKVRFSDGDYGCCKAFVVVIVRAAIDAESPQNRAASFVQMAASVGNVPHAGMVGSNE